MLVSLCQTSLPPVCMSCQVSGVLLEEKEKSQKETKRKEQKRKDYAFRLNEKPSIIPGCPDVLLERIVAWLCDASCIEQLM